LLSCGEAGHEEPWLILTDLGPADAQAAWYAWRSWIEHGFRDLKSDGWQLSKTRMSDPERVGRWWVAAALATLWVLEAGTEAQRLAIPATRTHGGAAGPEVTRLFPLGLGWPAGGVGGGGGGGGGRPRRPRAGAGMAPQRQGLPTASTTERTRPTYTDTLVRGTGGEGAAFSACGLALGACRAGKSFSERSAASGGLAQANPRSNHNPPHPR